ncbi:hypothetical protein [Streptomyces sp. NPDC005438]|uniref:hypothetical protein n=1 Tax=Streptomyces sp. NPDC005438 TaxID=3156880 RepID=UPI0033A4E387
MATKNSHRQALRAGTLSAGTTWMLLLSSPAFAARDDGDDPGPGISLAETLGLFVGLPLLAFVVIAGLVMAGSKSTHDNG